MIKIETFVMMDLETTGLPHLEGNKTKITEISLVVVKREHILNTKPGNIPRVVHKLTRLLNPKRLISFDSTNITGLCNELLEYETDFKTAFDTIDGFLNLCTKPICLVAHNGDRFDYPILKAELNNINKKLSDDILCLDSLKAFRALDSQIKNGAGDVASSPTSELNLTLDIHIAPTKSQRSEDKRGKKDVFEEFSFDEVDLFKIDQLCAEAYNVKIRKVNETTPPKQLSQESTMSSHTPVKANRSSGTIPKDRVANPIVKKRLPFSDKPKAKSYALNNVYERLLGRQPVNSHQAESDCLALLHCVVVKSKEFCEWSDQNCTVFDQMAPMEVGRRI